MNKRGRTDQISCLFGAYVVAGRGLNELITFVCFVAWDTVKWGLKKARFHFISLLFYDKQMRKLCSVLGGK